MSSGRRASTRAGILLTADTRKAVGLVSATAVLALLGSLSAGPAPRASAAASGDPAPVALNPSRQQTFALPDVADSWTDSSDSSVTHGAEPTLRVGVDSGTTAAHTAYLRFDTSRLPKSGRVVGVSLQLESATTSPAAVAMAVTAVPDGSPPWTESGVTSANAPDLTRGTRTGSYDGVVDAGTSVTVPLDSASNHGWLRRAGTGSTQSLAVTNALPEVEWAAREATEGASPTLVVVVQPDPVVAFFGSGTCDPTLPIYNNGVGTKVAPWRCHGKYVADALFGNPQDPSTLKVDVLAAAGDLQPSNGEYVKYCESSTLGIRGTPPNCPRGGFLSEAMLGRPSLLPILRATTGNHDYLNGDGPTGAQSNVVTDDSCAPSTTYTNAHGYFDSLDNVEKTGPKRASDAWRSDFMSSTGTGVPADCNKDRDGSGGYYWFQVGQAGDGTLPGWHWSVLVLNGNCAPTTAGFNPALFTPGNPGCNPGSDQYGWASAVLDHINGTEGGGIGAPQCVAVMMHQQAWSNTNWQRGGVVKSLYSPLWTLLHDKGVDLVVNGNLHVYERFLPMGPANGAGKPVLEDSTTPGGPGVIQITASTGGENHAKLTQNTDGVPGYDSPFYAPTSPNRLRDAGTGRQVSAAQDNSSYGTVNVTLHADGFDESFSAVPDGSGAHYSDSSTSTCQNTRVGAGS